ncbi:CBS domain-containing protein CBSCBSPB5-like [Telopea speciosissima]|uniref:CBS domain-containing protein CBSCBSPB5-like n=1 Tax=Telopea speciosissima TaxID=54955 RepID=UPI001CC7D74D|nr:CBS domain-containing protein CBSCBSPB5-like [Telopea speciosissima]
MEQRLRFASLSSFGLPNTFGFKIEDRKGWMHRFICDTRSLTDLLTSVVQRVGGDIDWNHLPQILYEDEDHDKVVIASDGDLAAVVDHARQVGLKSLRLHLDYSGSDGQRRGGSEGLDYAHRDAWASAYNTVAVGAAVVARLGVLAYLQRYSS